MKKIIKYLAGGIAVAIVLFIGFLACATLSDFQPEEKIELLKSKEGYPIKEQTFTIMSWNIGYAGLGDNMDFFYDGGTKVRDTKERTIQNLNQILEFISSQHNIDFYLLQEVDVHAKRSYYINERDSIEKRMPNYLSLYTDNYMVKFVPVPILEPMGYVQAGLQFLTKKVPVESNRYAFPGNYSWPTSLFMLDRCFMANRYKLDNGKELIIINTHNSAFDDGSLKQQQLEYLKIFLEAEYEKGNYFVVGGDWNQNPPQMNTSQFGDYADSENFQLSMIDESIFPSDWQWVYDANTATNRSNVSPYIKGETSTSILDFFLISPNIKANFITTIDLEFKNSDHQPVIMNFELQ